MINISWQYFPKSQQIPAHLNNVVKVFEKNEKKISSSNHKLDSNEVLAKIRDDLSGLGFKVEKSKKNPDKVKVPVLFGENGKLEKSFDADAFHESTGTVIEVEAGRAVANYQFLKDFFQGCITPGASYLVIAVRKIYLGKHRDFESVKLFFDAIYASERMELPLNGILIIGY